LAERLSLGAVLVVRTALLLASLTLVVSASCAPSEAKTGPTMPTVLVPTSARRPTPTAQATATGSVATATAAPSPPGGESRPAPPRVVDREFQAAVETYLDARAGTYGLAILDLDTGRTVLVNPDRAFPAASLYKLLVMYTVFRQIESGSLSLADTLTIEDRDAVEDEPKAGLRRGELVTVAEALEAMITHSSNYAAYALVRLTGGWAATARAAGELGLSGTSRTGGHFVTTPADLLAFLTSLAEGRLVSPAASEAMLAVLRRQTNNDRLPALLPEAAVVAHKTGELPGVRNDAGIVDGPGGRFVICVLDEQAVEDAATLTIARLARQAYDRYVQ
jgi:beta-lactamase class A